jgi:hypothetical protein
MLQIIRKFKKYLIKTINLFFKIMKELLIYKAKKMSFNLVMLIIYKGE